MAVVFSFTVGISPCRDIRFPLSKVAADGDSEGEAGEDVHRVDGWVCCDIDVDSEYNNDNDYTSEPSSRPPLLLLFVTRPANH